jgi:serine protease AprX
VVVLLLHAIRSIARLTQWRVGVAALLAVALSVGSMGVATSLAIDGEPVEVIVRELAGAGTRPEALVERVGGRVGRPLGIIDGFAAVIPRSALATIRAARGVQSVTENQRVQLHSIDGLDAKQHSFGTMYWVAQEITGAGEYWNDGLTGTGVDVALLDSGVVEVNGLRNGKVVYGPDLSGEVGSPDLLHRDTYGHGTHMAGIIAGRDDNAPAVVEKGNEESFLGMAPGARVVSIKLADATGATDVSQVIAAIDWVVQNKNTNGLNIRVLNLSFGTDGIQDYQLDPLTYAAEVAWRRGIVVVVAAGNEGHGSTKLNNPAYDPYVLAVGGADGNGTYDVKDDTIRDWSSRGDGKRNPDLVAPGASIVSLRDPGSAIDDAYPNATVADRFFKGTGTSQSAAVVSGAAALIIQQRPSITPDQVKGLLMTTAQALPAADATGQGAGMLDLKRARDAATPAWTQEHPVGTGTGSLEAARGSASLTDADGMALTGEQDAFGGAWDGKRWSDAAWSGMAWSGGSWSAGAWSGGSWLGKRWSGAAWSAGAWTGKRWSGQSWSGQRWSGETWSGKRWSSDGWR